MYDEYDFLAKVGVYGRGGGDSKLRVHEFVIYIVHITIL